MSERRNVKVMNRFDLTKRVVAKLKHDEAVIGGLVFATFATLFYVPSVFALLHRHKGSDPVEHPVTS